MAESPNTGDLKWINPTRIDLSDSNPRDRDFYTDEAFSRLCESIAQYGVLVPLIVHRTQTKGRYQLIDGERRLTAALRTKQLKVPAYVISLDDESNRLLTMFHIHMNQEGWDAVEQCKALEPLYAELKKAKDADTIANKKAIIDALVEETGISVSNAESRFNFLCWPDKIKSKIYDGTYPNYNSYIVEIEAKLIDPLNRNYPQIVKKYSIRGLRESLFEKLIAVNLVRAEDIREASVLTKSKYDDKERRAAEKLISQFIDDREFSFSEAKEQYLLQFPSDQTKPAITVRKLINQVRAITLVLTDYRDIRPGQLGTKKKELENALHDLVNGINEVIEGITIGAR